MLAPDTVLAIAPSNAVHTFGMQFPIDVLFVRRDGVVVKRVLNLKARRIAAAFRAFAVLEFATGSSTVAATQVGDRLELEIADNSQAPTPNSQTVAIRTIWMKFARFEHDGTIFTPDRTTNLPWLGVGIWMLGVELFLPQRR